LLIDTPPELRLQLVAAAVATLDAGLFTHAHADHVHGIDDLRAISVRQGAALDVYGAAATLAELARRFPYIFDHTPPQPGTSKPQLAAHVLEPDRERMIAGMAVRAVPLPHGTDTVLGYRVGSIAYLTDAKAVPERARAQLAGLEVLVLYRAQALSVGIIGAGWPLVYQQPARFDGRRGLSCRMLHLRQCCGGSRGAACVRARQWTSWCAGRCSVRPASVRRRAG